MKYRIDCEFCKVIEWHCWRANCRMGDDFSACDLWVALMLDFGMWHGYQLTHFSSINFETELCGGRTCASYCLLEQIILLWYVITHWFLVVRLFVVHWPDFLTSLLDNTFDLQYTLLPSHTVTLTLHWQILTTKLIFCAIYMRKRERERERVHIERGRKRMSMKSRIGDRNDSRYQRSMGGSPGDVSENPVT